MRPLLALFIRALREDTRGKGTYLLRTALVGLILFFLWITHQTQRWSGAVGRQFFEAVLWIDLFVVSVAGMSYFASAITEEKEDGTLGLLRMTDLNALAILLGKSTGRLIGALFLLAAQIPFALVAVTMGGVSVGQILAGYTCLLSFTFLLANAGLLASVVCRRSGAAAAFAGGGLLLFVFGSTWIRLVQANYGRTFPWLASLASDHFLTIWWRITPTARLMNILRTGFASQPLDAQAAVSVALGVVCFAAAWMLFEPCTRRALDATETLDTGRSRLRRSTRTHGLGAAAVRRKEFHTAGSRTRIFIKLTTTLIIGGWWCWEARRASWPSDSLGGGLLFTGAALLLLFLSADAARIFSLERQQKTLVSLCGLPLSARRIVVAKTLGSLLTNWPPLLPIGGGLALVVPQILKELKWITRTNELFYLAGGFIHAAFSYLLLPVFIAWLSLRFRRGAFAAGVTLWFVGNWMLGALLEVLLGEACLIVLPLISGTLLVVLACDIPRRLERLAAEE